MKTVKFVNPDTVLKIQGQEPIHAGNLTFEVYEKLLKASHHHADFFIVSEEEVKPKIKKDESKA